MATYYFDVKDKNGSLVAKIKVYHGTSWIVEVTQNGKKEEYQLNGKAFMSTGGKYGGTFQCVQSLFKVKKDEVFDIKLGNSVFNATVTAVEGSPDLEIVRGKTPVPINTNFKSKATKTPEEIEAELERMKRVPIQ
jgi:hypothetical protein